ncbi:hypothetical protein MNBD_GAMMA11-529 [hydrothermal vent metagenome]|uniref:Cytochrome c family protein n=1 Tax=hydrothermal vent metagenome TaxID=652676 RepID=A0A3B0X8K4_9ZZZZ
MNKNLKKSTYLAIFLLLTSASSYSHTTADSGSAITSAELNSKQFNYPQDLKTGASQTQLSNYAWRLFIASMQQTSASLSSGNGRGASDKTHNFIDTGESPIISNPLVFESLYHRTEAYPYYVDNNKPASPIDQAPVYQTYYEADNSESSGKATVKIKGETTVTGANYVYLDETNQISQNFLYYKKSNAPDFPVLFMAKVNALETDYAFHQTAKPSTEKSWDFPDQTLEIKTAWRRISDIKKSDAHKYHHAKSSYWVANSKGIPTLKEDTFALIAIHIIQKTANYPEFIFTTFEHIDAVTRDKNQTIVDPAYKTEYNQLAYQSPNSEPHTATANGAYYINAPGQPDRKNKLSTYTLPPTGRISQNYTTVVQPNTIISEVNNVNNQVNTLIQSIDKNNIWANYRLKGVQAVPTSDSDTSNFYLANIVVESSQPGVQLFSGVLLYGGVPYGGSPENPDAVYLVNCRGDKGNSSCKFPIASYNHGMTLPVTYNNVSLNVVGGSHVPTPQYNMGGCQGCHGAAQQAGRDFSFLASGALGAGKELDSVPAADLTAKQKAAHNKAMAKSANSQ